MTRDDVIAGECDCGHPRSLHASYGGCYVMVCRCRRDRVGTLRTGCPEHKRCADDPSRRDAAEAGAS